LEEAPLHLDTNQTATFASPERPERTIGTISQLMRLLTYQSEQSGSSASRAAKTAMNKAHAILIAFITFSLALAVACIATSIALGDVANAACLGQGIACHRDHDPAYAVTALMYCVGELPIAGLAYIGLARMCPDWLKPAD
jgi:hypothetical protein